MARYAGGFSKAAGFGTALSRLCNEDNAARTPTNTNAPEHVFRGIFCSDVD